jgi:pre-mRNA-splicing helicase BRR2
MMIEDDSLRTNILQMSEDDPRMVKIANFVNKYPSIDISYELDEELISGETGKLRVILEREADEGESIDLTVESQFYPFSKIENCK